jgi:hypothetical protein
MNDTQTAGGIHDLLSALSAPTPPEEVKKRPVFNKNKEKAGELDYVDARFCMDRLDDVMGPANWQDKYREVKGGIVAAVGIRIGDEWVWKEDVGTESTIEAVKGNYSDAFKRACVKWGIARDLYDAREEQQARPERPAYSGGNGGAPAPRASGGSAKRLPVPIETAPWICPVHGRAEAVPAGISRNTGRAYDAFYACPEGRDCSERAPRGLRVRPEHLAPANDEDDIYG